MTKKRSFDWIIQLLKNVGYIKWMGYYPETGIVEIVIAGHVAIDTPILEAMKKSRLRLKHKELPPLENSDTEKLRRDPLDAEYVAAVCDLARSSCPADTDDQQGD